MPLTITISEKAAEKAKQFARQENMATFGLRVGVTGGGCSGLMYKLGLEAEPKPGDKVLEERGVRLFVDPKSYIHLAGTVLDFSDGLNGKGFHFENPNAKSVCGCGNSFST